MLNSDFCFNEILISNYSIILHNETRYNSTANTDFFDFLLFEIYLFRVTRSSVINSCFSTRPWLNNTTTIHAWTTCGNSQCSYMTLQINFESIQ